MAIHRALCAFLLILPTIVDTAPSASSAVESATSALILSHSVSPSLSSASSSVASGSSSVSATATSIFSPASVSASGSTNASGSSNIPTITSASSISASFSTNSVSTNTTSGVLTSSAVNATATGSQSFNSGSGTETGPITVPITPISFTPFPTPSSPVGVPEFPSVDPESPPPPRDAPGLGGHVPDFSGAWNKAYARAEQYLSQGWSNEDKVNLATGGGFSNGFCVGNIPSLHARGFPGLCLEDSPLGVRLTDFVTAFPTGLSAAATWNRTLIRTRGLFMGQEHKGKGVNVALGPMMNMGRIAQGGRNWEGFGADPFLSGESAYETILGMQAGGVQACAKHYINNEQEHKRMQESSNVDDRTQHEIYAHPFMRSVMAGVASVMCSYNLINDTYACENEKMLDDVMKREFGFRGYIMTDWSAQQSTMSAAVGLDMSMPGDISFGSGTSWWGQNLTDFVANGTIAQARLDDMATRILASWFFLRQDVDYPPVTFNVYNTLDGNNTHVDVQDDHFTVVREIGAAGAVLLKNEQNALPLKLGKGGVRSIAVIGNDSGPAIRGPNGFTDRGGDDGILAMGWGSGTAQFPYLIDPLSAIQSRARKGKKSSERAIVTWWRSNWELAGAASAATEQDVAIVFVNADSGEGYITVDGNEGDRNNLTLWGNADALVSVVAGVNNNTVVVAHSVGPAIIEPWVEHPNVTAVIWAGVPGQEAGNSIADVLFGDVNPSGRLPYTIAKDVSDYGAQLVTGGDAAAILSIPYTEGLLIDYRWFDANNIEPRFEFGFGLSYTTFQYFNLHTSVISQPDSDSKLLEDAWAAGKATLIAEGSTTALWLHRPFVKVQFEVQNTGNVDGGEITQLYLHHPASAGEPPSVLKGFDDIYLHQGQKKAVTITLSRYDLSVWDVVHQGWVKPKGKITFSVGASSRDFRLKGSVPV
ncbi:glycosyl hydrolase family 3 N terminal domain-containing protein [Irpex rosettiformis]|uniref:Glycosyl hydrolase family 3 N terminal domain-containing protein n=1 Tax=Irpex rosettiformis TaxID=378272 RepID=A0ACB8TNS5_9APHY|nr:glycosyl hydrolase family 3 N terminal domain-containing protein [Irpex rosettiformis]